MCNSEETQMMDELRKLPHGGVYGVVKLGDFEIKFACKTLHDMVSENSIIELFKDIGEQIRVGWKYRDETPAKKGLTDANC